MEPTPKICGDGEMVREETLPLLAESASEVNSSEGPTQGASTSSAIFNLTTTIVGAGIMGLPAKMKILGLPGGLLMLIIMGFISESSIEHLLFCSIAVNAGSYADLMEVTNGKRGRSALSFCVIVNGIGILIIYLIIIGDVLSGSGDDYPGVFVTWAGGSSWWTSRTCVLSVTTLLVLAPLSAYERVDSLEVSSAISILLAAVFVVITAYLFFVKWISGSIDFSEIKLVPHFDTWQDVADLFSIIPTMCSAYVCHFNVHPVYAEMAKPREKRMQTAMRASLAICTALYCTTAIFGYLLFGDSIMSDVLANFNADLGVAYDQVLADIVRISYAVHLMLVFPVIHFSLRMTLDNVLYPNSIPLLKDKRRYASLTIILISTILLGALVIPDVEFAFDFMGSLATITMAFTLPGFAAIKIYPIGTFESIMPMVFIIIGIFVTITGISNSIVSIFT